MPAPMSWLQIRGRSSRCPEVSGCCYAGTYVVVPNPRPEQQMSRGLGVLLCRHLCRGSKSEVSGQLYGSEMDWRAEAPLSAARPGRRRSSSLDYGGVCFGGRRFVGAAPGGSRRSK
ncbi:unnamed protein product [Symbiodinium sp. CCMP2592]|nr:unnamed protein product [Symbiodinium sp. CCMP2592]